MVVGRRLRHWRGGLVHSRNLRRIFGRAWHALVYGSRCSGNGFRNASSLAGRRLNRLRASCNCFVPAVFNNVNATENHQKSGADSGQHARAEHIREAAPPRCNSFGHNWLAVADDSFRFQLRAYRNPYAIRWSHLGGKVFGGHHDCGKIREQILAARAACEMFASFGRKRTKTFRLQNCFEFLTPHTADSAGHRADWLRPQKSQNTQVRVTPSTLAPF